MRRCIGFGEATDFPAIQEMKDAGHTDYLVFVHRFADDNAIGEMDCVYSSWMTRHPEGFTDAGMVALRRLVPPLALAIKAPPSPASPRCAVRSTAPSSCPRRLPKRCRQPAARGWSRSAASRSAASAVPKSCLPSIPACRSHSDICAVRLKDHARAQPSADRHLRAVDGPDRRAHPLAGP